MSALTALVVTAKDAVVAPSATVTLAGTVAAELLLERVTTAPPAGAALPRVTVAVEPVPPVRLAGFSDIEKSVAGLMVRVAVWIPW